MQFIAAQKIETEGFDLNELKLFFDAGMHPENINFERANLSRQHR